ncbi:carbon-nitrogen hydrolase family protein [Williamsia herbipolensis]|uniref:Carbon-nitrogen hydrolase family protein n=1 Tax=Williamsia herbipolensis TaxID=1603258 RepID=A0AAU4JZG5_9NOCA|nr:carbon-nitrogen hydrolase family protein [Williamsia herbipolensis]
MSLRAERSRTLRVAAAQPHTVLDDVAANAHAHARAIRECRARLVVFPELSLTGYSMDAPVVSPGDAALEPLIEACAVADSVALVGAAVHHGDGRTIGVIAVDSGGARVVYRKMSLGGPELGAYRRGMSPGVIEVDGWRVGLGVCKDTRMPEHLDLTAALGMDVYAAGLVHAPHEIGAFDERARAIIERFGVPVVFAGFAGPSGGGYRETSGGSGIWVRRGEPVAKAGVTPGEFAVADLERQASPDPE